MESSLQLSECQALALFLDVSILVLMESSLQSDFRLDEWFPIVSFNPCFNGIFSSIVGYNNDSIWTSSFQSLF